MIDAILWAVWAVGAALIGAGVPASELSSFATVLSGVCFTLAALSVLMSASMVENS